MIKNFITALRAEHIKIKGTGLYLLSCILGIVSPLINALVIFFSDNDNKSAKLPYNYYFDFIRECVNPFVGFFFPLLIIITVSRITQIDHRNGGWQLMETQPLYKFSIYFSKFKVVLIACLVSILSLVIFGYLSAWILSLLKEIPKEAEFSFPFAQLCNLILRMFAAGILLAAFQYVISVLISSFIWSIVIGFFGLLLNSFLIAFNLVPAWSPFEVLNKVGRYIEGSDLGYWITYSESISVLLSIILLYIGFEWYKHKKIKWAFFGKPMRFIKLLAVIIVFGGLLYYTLSPNTMPNTEKTIIAGEIEGDLPIKNVYLTDQMIGDTLAVIPVKEKKFHQQINNKLFLDKYVLLFDEAYSSNIIMSSNDSIFISFKSYNNLYSIKHNGTRLAENNYTSSGGSQWSSIAYYLEQNSYINNPDFFTGQLIREWERAMKESDKFRTADNYMPKSDFLEKNKKLISLQFLNYWNEFLKKRAALYPDETTEESVGIKALKETVSLTDESLLSNREYFEYIRSQMIAQNKDDIDENTKSFEAIMNLKDGFFKDKMLLFQLNKSLNDAFTADERTKLIEQYADNFSNKNYRHIILKNYKILESLSTGKTAPLFDAITLENKIVSLNDFKGKYVIIDVWATWCGPCKIQSPYFEKLAIKYKDSPIQFIAASVDQKIDNWFIEAKTKSKSVIQLHINDIKKFNTDYDVQSIPRFILIDPDGNLLEAKMIFPSESGFEKILRENLGLNPEK